MSAGRPSKYEVKVKPYFEQIKKWKEQGADNKTIAKELGIAHSTFATYIAKFQELSDLLKNADRKPLVEDLRSALVKKALGFTYEEKKIYKKKDEDGNEQVYTEITSRYSPPDVAAINLALKNMDKDNWANDPQALALKREELEIRKLLADLKAW